MVQPVPQRCHTILPLRYVTALVVVGAVLSGIPAASFTSADLTRGSSATVVDDPTGVLSLDVAASVQKNNRERLVDVTNNLGKTVSVTVTLQDGSQGDLYIGSGDTTGSDSVTFNLADGATQTIEVQTTGNPNTDMYFDVTATATAIDITMNNRFTTIQGGGGPPGGP